jgi:hypothetical protein
LEEHGGRPAALTRERERREKREREEGEREEEEAMRRFKLRTVVPTSLA